MTRGAFRTSSHRANRTRGSDSASPTPRTGSPRCCGSGGSRSVAPRRGWERTDSITTGWSGSWESRASLRRRRSALVAPPPRSSRPTRRVSTRAWPASDRVGSRLRSRCPSAEAGESGETAWSARGRSRPTPSPGSPLTPSRSASSWLGEPEPRTSARSCCGISLSAWVRWVPGRSFPAASGSWAWRFPSTTPRSCLAAGPGGRVREPSRIL